MPTTLADLLKPMLRVAAITVLPGTTPNSDQYGELIPMVNRMLASLGLNGHLIYTSSIDAYSLVAGQKTYTIGPGGDFNAARPTFIKGATILFPTSPVLRRELAILDDAQWRAVSIQDVTGAPPYELYYDGGMSATGRANIYLRFQPPAGYSLELYTWLQLPVFTATTDNVILPPGYEELIVQQGALRAVQLYPLESKLDGAQRAELRRLAGDALHSIESINMNAPEIKYGDKIDGDGLGGYVDGRGWLDGGLR